MSDDIWEIYAVRYAEHQRKAAENYIGGDPHDVLQPLDYFVWVIKNDKRTFVVDTGFDQPVGTKRGRTVITPVGEGLKRLGIDPDKVEDVIISHMHYDHCGNVDLFPRARYHVQDKEMHYCTGRCMCHKQLRFSYEEDYVVSMLRKLFAGRVTFHDGVSEIAPGITLHHIGGHAMGLQSIRVKTKRGFVMLAADAVHLFPHLDEARVFPTTYNLAEVLEGYETLKRLASSRNHIVPGHDPAVMKIYPAASDALKGWSSASTSIRRCDLGDSYASEDGRAASRRTTAPSRAHARDALRMRPTPIPTPRTHSCDAPPNPPRSSRTPRARCPRAFGGDLRHHRADRDPRRAIGRKAIDAGRDRRKRDRLQAVLGGERRAPCGSRRPAGPASPLPPPFHTGPTAWMTCFAGSS